MYKRKTRDEYVLYVDYGQGWEEELTENTLAELRQRIKEYRENCPGYPLRGKKRRVRIA